MSSETSPESAPSQKAAFGRTFRAKLTALVALLVALTDLRSKALLVFCFMIPLMIPPQITALSWIQLFGPSSALLKALGMAPALGSPHPLYTAEGIMLLLGIQHAPLVFLALRAGLRSMPREMVEAARASGAGHLRVLATIVLPLMTPALVAGDCVTRHSNGSAMQFLAPCHTVDDGSPRYALGLPDRT